MAIVFIRQICGFSAKHITDIDFELTFEEDPTGAEIAIRIDVNQLTEVRDEINRALVAYEC